MTSVEHILPVQVKKIHIAKTELKLSDENYRDILSNFKNSYGWPCKSSKELNRHQADVVLDIFKKQLGWKEKKNKKVLKYEEFNTRDPKFASPAQMRLIEATWMNNINVKEKTEAALNHYISRILKVDHITFVLKKDVNRLLKAIKSITQKQRSNPPQAGDEVVGQ